MDENDAWATDRWDMTWSVHLEELKTTKKVESKGLPKPNQKSIHSRQSLMMVKGIKSTNAPPSAKKGKVRNTVYIFLVSKSSIFFAR